MILPSLHPFTEVDVGDPYAEKHDCDQYPKDVLHSASPKKHSSPSFIENDGA
jgi:hypothetical protein